MNLLSIELLATDIEKINYKLSYILQHENQFTLLPLACVGATEVESCMSCYNCVSKAELYRTVGWGNIGVKRGDNEYDMFCCKASALQLQ
jgi:hypothetical protein